MKTRMIKQTAATLTLLAAALLTSCAPQSQSAAPSYLDSSELHNSNILGGVLADSKFQKAHGIVQLKIFSLTGEATCTGSLIARDLVLTAAHCIADEGLRGVAVLFALDDRKLTEDLIIYASNGAIHPEFMPTDDTTKAWNDMAILKLEKLAPADFQLAKLPTAETIKQLAKDSKLTLAGFGITNAIIRKIVKGKDGKPTVVELPGRGTGSLRRVSNITVTQVTADQKEISLDQTNLRGACHGDSGGPALLRLADGSLVQVGVTSRGTNSLGNCNEGAIYTGVFGQLDWIKLASAELQKPPQPEGAAVVQAN